MFIFGRSGEKRVARFQLLKSNCQAKESLVTIGLIRYAHMWYIILFPAGKRFFAICNHCKYATDEHQVPADIPQQVQQCKEEVKRSWYYWPGLCMAVIVIVLVTLLPLFNRL